MKPFLIGPARAAAVLAVCVSSAMPGMSTPLYDMDRFLSEPYPLAPQAAPAPPPQPAAPPRSKPAPAVEADDVNDVNDPLETINRGIFSFNEFFLQWVLGPISGVYKDFVPDPIRESVGNILHLVKAPIILANDLLQAEWERAWITTQRTVVNATIGVAGTFDVAETLDLPRHTEDFGQTLAVWGIGEGFYLVIPFFGPSNPRDGIGKLVDGYFHPLTRWAANTDREEITYGLFSASAVHDYSEIKDELDQIRKTSIDYYAAIRSMYRQKRAAEIRNGAEVEFPPIPDLGFDIDVDEIDKPSAGAGGKPPVARSGEISAN
ncbi:MAG: VacJ family lipoprotein [Acidobacteria bacterium]|nr:VacJ family lipoprotein [Acidobacteriota bacterium]